MKSPAAFERLSLSDKLKELYRMCRQALAKSNNPSEPSSPTIPEVPIEGTHTLKSVAGVLTWIEDTEG